jgi:predicted DNA-binding transcriptional regulator YafY
MRNVLERLINLLAMLLTAGRPVTADQIRQTIPGYAGRTDEAFHRMFERDKELLRRIGIPLETRATDAWEVQHGYMIDPERYRLADPGLTDEERTALFLAAQVARLGGTPYGQEAVLKLGGAQLAGTMEPLVADLGEGAELLGELFIAVAERRGARFTYRGRERAVDPYGLGHRRGHWYLVGAEDGVTKVYRVERLTRLVVGDLRDAYTVPAGFSVQQAIDLQPWEAGDQEPLRARVRFSPDVAWWAGRRLGHDPGPPDDDGSLTAELDVLNLEAFVGWVLSFGADAEVLSPPAARQAVLARIEQGAAS